jgi:hypothetical protein
MIMTKKMISAGWLRLHILFSILLAPISFYLWFEQIMYDSFSVAISAHISVLVYYWVTILIYYWIWKGFKKSKDA